MISNSFQKIKKVRSYVLEVAIQCGYAGMFVIVAVSLKHGLSHYVFAVYRHILATLVIAPFALVLERGRRPKMTLPIFLQIMLLGLLEPVIDQNLYYMGMEYTSATFASATVNLAPAFTFIMAILLRLERVNIKKPQNLGKVIGTIITIIGAMVMTLYKGPIITKQRSHHRASNESAAGKHWILGTIMLLIGCCSYSGFFILQSITIKKYPAELTLTALVCLMGAVEVALLTFAMEHADMNVWKVGWDSRLLAIAYSGLVIGYYVQGVVNKDQGPVFIAAFSPLSMVVTAALGVIFLAEQLHLGR
ncbi:WAT1-related protein At1g21890-like [Mangifera indica]|uniref:WAT1-related protein At1g21890-like n=1 Tax=Mangifera indica TaxID=29780 RepID=UPI001CFA19AD|nr:WAT1-related protein At1g21890-like [Mangifera indica]